MKKTFSLILCLALSLSCLSPIFVAAEQVTECDEQRYFYTEGEGVRLISVEYIPDEQAEAEIPSKVISALGIPTEDGGTATYGTSIPGSTDTYDLSNGKDPIILSQDTLYYSDYVYIGHGGKVMMNIKETSGTVSDDEFLVKIFVRNWQGTGTTKASMAVQRNTSDSVKLYATVKESDKVYFTIDPQGNGMVELGALNNYIKKN